MNDNLNEIGKYINETGKTSQDALAKQVKHRPTIETVRDVFDDEVPFTMMFVSDKRFPTIILSLEFFGPPPSIGCCADCYCTVCRLFTDGETVLSLGRIYIPGTVYVTINNVPTTNFEQTSPSGGIVTLTETLDPQYSYLVKVCYVYKYATCT